MKKAFQALGRRKKLEFDAECTLHGLDNVPYVAGLFFVKWKLKGSGYRGFTPRVPVQQHNVAFESTFKLQATLTVGPDGVLEPCSLTFLVKQESSADSIEDIGFVKINLAEFAASRSLTRRYLLQDARINSILRVTVQMVQTKGDPVFKVPESRQIDVDADGLRQISNSAGGATALDPAAAKTANGAAAAGGSSGNANSNRLFSKILNKNRQSLTGEQLGAELDTTTSDILKQLEQMKSPARNEA